MLALCPRPTLAQINSIEQQPEAGRLETPSIRLLCFNVLQGGGNAANVGFNEEDFPGGRLSHIVAVILETNADIVCVLEDGPRLIGALTTHDPRWRVVGSIYTRWPIAPIATEGRLKLARVTLPDGSTLVVANDHWWPGQRYGPFAAQGLLRDHAAAADPDILDPAALEDATLGPLDQPIQADYDRCLRMIAPHLEADERVALAGDFNEPSHLDWTARYAERGPDRWVNNPTGSPLRFKIAWRGSQRLADAGMRDAYRIVHPDETAEPGNTWTPPYPPGTPGRRPPGDQVSDRIDRIYLGPGLTATQACVVGEDPASAAIVHTPWPSDHRAVLVEFTTDD